MGSAESPQPEAHPHWSLAALSAITLCGLALRLTNVGESLWLDELHTGWVVKDAWSDVAWRAQIGNQSPVWFYAVKVVTTLGGASEFTLRLLSLLAGTALMPVAYWLVRIFVSQHDISQQDNGIRNAGGLAGLLAAALIAVDPNCIFYATEARPYACLQLSAALQLGLFWQILWQPTTQLRLGWMLLTALTFHLHYTGILILLGELIVLLGYYLLCRKPVPYRPWRAAFDWQIAVMLCLPAIGHVLEVGQRREMWDRMSAVPNVSDLLTVFPLSATFGVTLLACGFAVLQRYGAKSPAPLQANWRALAVIALWLVVPLLAAFAAAHFDLARVFLRRYLMAVAIGPMLLTALLVTRMPSVRWRWLVALCVLGYAVYESNIVQQMREDGRTIPSRGEDWRGAIETLRALHAEEPLPVLISSGLIEESAIYRSIGSTRPVDRPERLYAYLRFPLRSSYRLQVSRVESAAEWELRQLEILDANPELLDQLGRGRHWVWLISRADPYNRGVSFVRDRNGLTPVSFGRVQLGKAELISELRPTPPSPQSPPSTP